MGQNRTKNFRPRRVIPNTPPQDQQNQTEEQQQPKIPESALEMVRNGHPAVLIVDDGQNAGAYVQGMSLPTLIGLLLVQLELFKERSLTGK